MAEPTFKLVLENRIREGEESSAVNQRLAALFRVDAPRAAQLMQTAAVVKRGLTAAEAERYRRAIEQMGALCRLEPEVAAAPAADPKPVLTLVEIEERPSAAPAKPAKLSLHKPLTPEPTAAPLSKCPKCGHQARHSAYALLNDGECPACGVVIAEYLQHQEELLESKEWKSYLRNLPSASIKARVLASLHTYFSMTFALLPTLPLLALVAVIMFHIKMDSKDIAVLQTISFLGDQFSKPDILNSDLKPEIYSLVKKIKSTAKTISTTIGVLEIFFIGFFAYYFVWKIVQNDGLTCGQEWMGLRVINCSSETHHRISIYLRRLLIYFCLMVGALSLAGLVASLLLGITSGSPNITFIIYSAILAFSFFPVAVVMAPLLDFLNPAVVGVIGLTGWIGLLFPMFSPNRRSLADWLSKTTQVQEPSTHSLHDLYTVLGKYLLASLGTGILCFLILYLGIPSGKNFSERMLGKPLNPGKIQDSSALGKSSESAEKLRDFLSGPSNLGRDLESAIKTLAEMQQRYYKDTGHYAESKKKLFAYFQKNYGGPTWDLLQMRATPSGFEVGVPVGDDLWRMATDKHGAKTMRCDPIDGGYTGRIDHCDFTPVQ